MQLFLASLLSLSLLQGSLAVPAPTTGPSGMAEQAEDLISGSMEKRFFGGYGGFGV